MFVLTKAYIQYSRFCRCILSFGPSVKWVFQEVSLVVSLSSSPAPLPICAKFQLYYSRPVRKGDELPITVSLTGRSGPARVWGHVKFCYSAREITEGPRVYRSKKKLGTVEPPSRLNIVLPLVHWLAGKWY